jgi:hypothetical protein
MSGTQEDLINYRIARAKDTLDDAHILAKMKNGTLQSIVYTMQPIMLLLLFY